MHDCTASDRKFAQVKIERTNFANSIASLIQYKGGDLCTLSISPPEGLEPSLTY